MSLQLIRVLLVEDSPDDAFLIERMLQKSLSSGYKFAMDHCALLAEALHYLDSHEPDAVLLDLGLPDGRGLEMLTTILDRAPAIPIVVLTGLQEEKSAIDALKKGAQDYLIKDQTDHQLLARSLLYAIERKRTEGDHSLLAAIVANSDAAVVSQTLGGIITSWNKGAEAIYGYTAAEALGQSITLIIPPDNHGQLEDILKKVRRGEHFLLYETLGRRQDGANINVSQSISPIRNKAGAIIGASIIARDITQRKRAEEILQRYELLAGHSRDIILFIRLEDGRIMEANTAATSAYGYSRAEMLELTIFDLRAPNDRKLTAAQMKEAYARGLLFQTDHRRGDGSLFPVEVNAGGAVIGGAQTLVSVIRDTTERKKIEEERERLIFELREALAQVKTLSGFLPICASCKKIRDDQGYWQQIEAYIRDHSEAEFSHSICPECARELYRDYYDDPE